jgi:hypothetical protein
VVSSEIFCLFGWRILFSEIHIPSILIGWLGGWAGIIWLFIFICLRILFVVMSLVFIGFAVISFSLKKLVVYLKVFGVCFVSLLID